MNVRVFIGVVGVAWLGVAAAQEERLYSVTLSATNSPDTDAGTNGVAASTSILTPGDLRAASVQPLTEQVQAEGALTYLFGGTNIFELPGRLWSLVTPSSPIAKTEPIRNERGLSSRPWSAIVGWTPGASAFPDATTHEPTIGLITFRRAR
jgi:hypothetical protein